MFAPVASWQDPPPDPVASLLALQALQERTRAFRAFAPLPREQSSTQPSTGYEDVKIVAVARTVLNNLDHIQVDWTAHGPKLAQVALLFGASDLDRVAPSDDAPLGHRRAPLEEVQRNIKSAFLDPIERDGRFEQVAR
jgi:aminodeoxyfutalosine synthase